MRYLFCALASHGYVYPAIGIAKGLQAKGHEVAFVTGRAFSDVVEHAQLTNIPDPDATSFQVSQWAGIRGVYYQIEHIKKAIKQFAPDVLVATQLTLGPLIVGQQLNLPVGIIGLSSYLWPTKNLGTAGVVDQELANTRLKQHDDMLKTYNKLCQFIGLSLKNYQLQSFEASPLLGDLFLLRNIPQLEGYEAQFPQRVHYVGDCLWEPDTELPENIQNFVARAKNSRKPIVYVQHSGRWTHQYQQNGKVLPGSKDYWPIIVDSVKAEAFHAIATTDDKAFLEATYPDQMLVLPHISHQQIMPHVDAVIGNGTTSLLLGALTHGRSLFIISIGSENEFIGSLCNRVNVGVHEEARHLTPESFSAGLTKLLTNSKIATQTKALQNEFLNFGGNTKAVYLLEKLGAERKPILRERELERFPINSNIQQNNSLPIVRHCPAGCACQNRLGQGLKA